MAHHGGYGVAVQMSRQVLQHLMIAAHRAGIFPDRIEATEPVGDVDGSGNAVIALDMWLDAPMVFMTPADGIVFQIRAVGSLAITASSVDPAPRQCRLHMRIPFTVAPTLVGRTEIVENPDPPFMPEVVDLADLHLTVMPGGVQDSQIVVLNGDPLPQAWIDFFASPLFRAGVGWSLANNTFREPLIEPLPEGFVALSSALRIGDGTTTAGEQITHDEFVTFGFRLDNADMDVHLIGDPAEVESMLADDDIAIAIDAGAAPLIARTIRREVNERQDDAEITSLTVDFRDGEMHVTGHGEGFGGGADFSLDVVPTIGRPETLAESYDDEYGSQHNVYTPPTDEVWIDLRNVDVDVSPDAWVVVVGIAGAALLFVPYVNFVAAPAIAVIANFVTSSVAAIPRRIVQQGQPVLLAANQTLRLPDGDGLLFDFSLRQLRYFPDRLQGRIRLRPQGTARIEGPTSVAVDQMFAVQTYTLTRDRMRWRSADPEARIRFEARRSDTGDALWTKDVAASAEGARRFDVNFGELAPNAPGFVVTARVYRSGAGKIVNVVNRSIDVYIADALDRRHPFVRWHYQIIALQQGHKVYRRKSALHRTDWPGRCRFADRISKHVEELEYLDVLPFEIENIGSHSKEICEYCFFGGPGKTQLIFDPPVQPKPPPRLRPPRTGWTAVFVSVWRWLLRWIRGG